MMPAAAIDAATAAMLQEELTRAGFVARGAVAELSRALEQLDRYLAGPAGVGPRSIRSYLRARRARAYSFGEGLFEDPAWDMLLDLYAAEVEGDVVSVSSLCIAAAVAPTTALRWIGRLCDRGLIERGADPRDRRRSWVRLTPVAREAMADYLRRFAPGWPGARL